MKAAFLPDHLYLLLCCLQYVVSAKLGGNRGVRYFTSSCLQMNSSRRTQRLLRSSQAQLDTWPVMEDLLKQQLTTSVLRCVGKPSGGYTCNRWSYETDSGRVFVKHNSDARAKVMFDGEFASLDALCNTCTVRVPKPVKVVKHPTDKGWILVMEHLDLSSLSKFQAALGEQMARLHLHNESLKHSNRARVGNMPHCDESSGYVERFGFHCDTSCGIIPMPNEWQSNWVEFFTRQRLQPQLDLIEREFGDREVRDLWPQLQRKIPGLFEGVVMIEPSLQHGDFWSGNTAENEEGPVIFDPASFYGHHEFDLAGATLFGGFTKEFYDAYHHLVPKAPGFAGRQTFYQLFHCLCVWNHSVPETQQRHRSKALSVFRELISL